MEVEDTNQATGLMLEHLFRHQSGRLIAHLAGVLGAQHLDLAEETVQEAMVRALRVWPFQGIPENPSAWLYRTAYNIAIDHLRRGRLFVPGVTAEQMEASRAAVDSQDEDDELRLILMCCHPAIPREAAVALSLKIAGGFSVREIARAFLAEEAAIAQRIVRAKKQIRDKRLTLEIPASGAEARERIDSVLEVLYLLFNEGYTAHDGDRLIRQDLCVEALRLASLVAGSKLATPAVHALAALFALQAARFAARVNASGDLVPLEEQDRALWDARLLDCGFRYFEASMSGERVTGYHIQAAIAATHARAAHGGETPWAVILALYDQLMTVEPSAVVALNRAVAVWRVHGPEEGLRAWEAIEGDAKLREYHLYRAVEGHLRLALGDRVEAARSFRAALERPCTEPERRLLQRKLAECG